LVKRASDSAVSSLPALRCQDGPKSASNEIAEAGALHAPLFNS
jgi:hypothetical protein